MGMLVLPSIHLVAHGRLAPSECWPRLQRTQPSHRQLRGNASRALALDRYHRSKNFRSAEVGGRHNVVNLCGVRGWARSIPGRSISVEGRVESKTPDAFLEHAVGADRAATEPQNLDCLTSTWAAEAKLVALRTHMGRERPETCWETYPSRCARLRAALRWQERRR